MNAFGAAALIIGLLLTLAPVVGSANVMLAIGLPTMVGGLYALTFRGRGTVARAAGVSGAVLVLAIAGFVALRRVADPGATEFFYDGELLVFADSSPLAEQSFPVLTDDPSTGRDAGMLVGPIDSLTVSCWVNGRYDGEELAWASVVDGDYRSLWVPLSSLSAMAPGPARELLPCSDWRWEIQGVP